MTHRWQAETESSVLRCLGRALGRAVVESVFQADAAPYHMQFVTFNQLFTKPLNSHQKLRWEAVLKLLLEAFSLDDPSDLRRFMTHYGAERGGTLDTAEYDAMTTDELALLIEKYPEYDSLFIALKQLRPDSQYPLRPAVQSQPRLPRTRAVN